RTADPDPAPHRRPSTLRSIADVQRRRHRQDRRPVPGLVPPVRPARLRLACGMPELGTHAHPRFELSDETYSYRRIHAQLVRWGETCTLELILRRRSRSSVVPPTTDISGP